MEINKNLGELKETTKINTGLITKLNKAITGNGEAGIAENVRNHEIRIAKVESNQSEEIKSKKARIAIWIDRFWKLAASIILLYLTIIMGA